MWSKYWNFSFGISPSNEDSGSSIKIWLNEWKHECYLPLESLIKIVFLPVQGRVFNCWIPLKRDWASLVAQMIKNLPAKVWSLGWEDPLEKGVATHSSILAWEIPWTEKAGRLQSMELQTVGHDWVTNFFFFNFFLKEILKEKKIRKSVLWV